MRKFVLNDETQTNNYGFRVLNAGIDLSRFKQNPICLNDHRNNTKDVLGTWTNLELKGNEFLGTPEFDTEDAEGKEVVRKVESGKIKGCSLGFDFDKDDFKMIDGQLVLTKCELKEISIVAIPSNSKTIALYDKEGKKLTADDVSTLCLSAKETKINTKDTTMKKVISYLQLSDNSDESAVLTAVQAIEAKLTAKSNDYDALKLKFEEMASKEEAVLKAAYEDELEKAIKDGRIDELGKAPIDAMVLTSGYAQGVGLLKALPKRNSIADRIITPAAQLASFDKMTWSELDKGNHLGKLKADNFEYYKERFVAHFGKEPNN